MFHVDISNYSRDIACFISVDLSSGVANNMYKGYINNAIHWTISKAQTGCIVQTVLRGNHAVLSGPCNVLLATKVKIASYRMSVGDHRVG